MVEEIQPAFNIFSLCSQWPLCSHPQGFGTGIFLWLLMGRGLGEDSRCQEEGRIFLPGSLQGLLPSSTAFSHASQAVVRQRTLSPEFNFIKDVNSDPASAYS